jgi:hypothetical protein
MKSLKLLAAGVVLAFALPALAQMPQVHVRGKVASLAGNTLVVATREGPAATVKLSPDWAVVTVRSVNVSAIQPGSFIGTTNVERPDGSGKSLEVHVFPPGVKMGEGHYPWDLQPGSMMTNGTVGKVVASGDGRVLEISYPSGTRRIVVPPNVPVVQIGGGDHALVKPGVPVVVFAVKLPSGELGANRVVVGVDGALPPM